MNLAYDRFRLHAYVDGELTPDEVADFERLLAQDPDATAEVAALRAQNGAMHERYDGLLNTPAATNAWSLRRRRPMLAAGSAWGWGLAATVLVAAGVGLGTGWVVRGQADGRDAIASGTIQPAAVEGRLQAFVQVASLSHAVFVPEVRHPVEVTAADEGHLVTWLSKRLDAPLVVPHLGDAGWDLLGGRLLPARGGPVAQFMYQDHAGRRMTLAVSKGVTTKADRAGKAAPALDGAAPSTAFRIAEENGSTVFYWIDADFAYALTGKLTRGEMTALASRVYRQLDR